MRRTFCGILLALAVAAMLALVSVATAGSTHASAQQAQAKKAKKGKKNKWVNDFERAGDDTTARSWNDFGLGTIDRVASGYSSPSGYASGIASAHGNWHARLRDGGCGAARFTSTCTGPFTRYGKSTSANPTFPKKGYTTEVDVYLDVGWAGGKIDYRFDWSSAINNSAGGFKRDFVFNVGTPINPLDPPGFWMNASTNATRSGAFPQNPCPAPNTPPNGCRTPVEITQSGWYTFRHRFYSRNVGGTKYLAVDFSVLKHKAVVAFWTIISSPDDPMTTVGGDRYGWFVINEINDLAVDCSSWKTPGKKHPKLGHQCKAAERRP